LIEVMSLSAAIYSGAFLLSLMEVRSVDFAMGVVMSVVVVGKAKVASLDYVIALDL
jgi:hypothetical protein